MIVLRERLSVGWRSRTVSSVPDHHGTTSWSPWFCVNRWLSPFVFWARGRTERMVGWGALKNEDWCQSQWRSTHHELVIYIGSIVVVLRPLGTIRPNHWSVGTAKECENERFQVAATGTRVVAPQWTFWWTCLRLMCTTSAIVSLSCSPISELRNTKIKINGQVDWSRQIWPALWRVFGWVYELGTLPEERSFCLAIYEISMRDDVSIRAPMFGFAMARRPADSSFQASPQIIPLIFI